MPQQLYTTWDALCRHIVAYDDVQEAQFNAIFAQVKPQAFSEGFLMLTSHTSFIKNYIETHYLGVLQRALEELYHIPFVVCIEIDTTEAPNPLPQTAIQNPVSQGNLTDTAETHETLDHRNQEETLVGKSNNQAEASMQEANSNPGFSPQFNELLQKAKQVAESQSAAQGNIPEHHLPTTPSPECTTTTRAAISEVSHETGSVDVDDLSLEELKKIAAQVLGQNYAENPCDTSVISAGMFESQAPETHKPQHYVGKAEDKPSSNLTFENFVIGDSNRMAYSMALAVAEDPGKPQFNPLFIYGRSGLGKTHLLRAIENYINIHSPHLVTRYIDSQELLSDFTTASIEHNTHKSSFNTFMSRYEEVDVLLIDDIQHLQGKTQTLNIVFQIFNKLRDMDKQVVLAADRAPNNIDIDERYRSRFNSGGTSDIQPPDVETKLGVIKSFIAEYKQREGDRELQIPDDIQLYIAEASSSNIRELKSAVTKLITQMSLFGNTDISVEEVKALLQNHFSGGSMKRLAVSDIQQAVEEFYKISHADLTGKKRTQNIAWARHTAIYLCRQLLDLPYAAIGRSFSNREHATIKHSIQTAEDKLAKDREYAEELEVIQKMIKEA